MYHSWDLRLIEETGKRTQHFLESIEMSGDNACFFSNQKTLENANKAIRCNKKNLQGVGGTECTDLVLSSSSTKCKQDFILPTTSRIFYSIFIVDVLLEANGH